MNKSDTFFKSSFKYLSGDIILAASSSLIILPIIINQLDNKEFANYIFSKGLIELFSFLIIFGTITAYSKFNRELSSDIKKEYFNSILINLIFFKIIINIFLIFIGNFLWHLCSIAALMSSIATLEGTRLRLNFKSTSFFMLQLSSAIIMIISVYFFLHLFNNKLFFLILVLVFIYFFHLFKILLRSNLNDFPSFSSHFKNSKKLLKFGIPILIGYLSFYAYQRAPIFFLKYYESFELLSKFGITQQLSLVIFLVSGAASKYYQPMIFQKNEGLNNKITYLYVFIVFLLLQSP